jgi:Peptidase S24-like
VKLFRDIRLGFGGRRRNFASRAAAGALAGASLCLAAGCVTSEPDTPPSADVPVDQAWQDAKTVAARTKGGVPVVGTGISMQPVYGENTMLVITPIKFDELKAGMVVAYVNRAGVRIVHRLVDKVGNAWRVKGLNNEIEDRELVTQKNLIGVIYASFNYDGESAPAPAPKH